MNKRSYLFIVFIAALTLNTLSLPAVSSAQGRTDEDVINDLVRRFFSAYADKDNRALMALWSSASPDLAGRRQAFQSIFDNTGAIELKSLTVESIKLQNQRARAQVMVELAGLDRATGKQAEYLGKIERILYLVKEDGGWRVWRYAPAILVQALISARTSEERKWLLTEEQTQLDKAYLSLSPEHQKRTSIAEMRKHTVEMLTGEFHKAAAEQAEAADFGTALRFNDIALDIAEFIDDPKLLGWSHIHHGYILDMQNRYIEASAQFKEALQIFRDARAKFKDKPRLDDELLKLSPNDPEALKKISEMIERAGGPQGYAESVTRDATEYGLKDGETKAAVNLGKSLMEMGRYAETLRVWEDSLPIFREMRRRWEMSLDDFRRNKIDPIAYNDARTSEMSTLNNLGNLYRAVGQEAEALNRFEEALKIARELKDNKAEMDLLNSQAIVQQGLARKLKEQARAQPAGQHKGDADREAAKAYGEARAGYEKGLKLAREIDNKAGLEAALINLGVIYLEEENYRAAEEKFDEGLKLAETIKAPQTEARARLNMAQALRKSGRTDEARQSLDAALKVAEEIGDPDLLFRAYAERGEIHRARKQWAEAAEAFQRAIEQIEVIRAQTTERSLQTSFFEQYTEPYRLRASSLLKLGGKAALTQAFTVSEQAKARALVDILKGVKPGLPSDLTDEERGAEQRLKAAVAQAARSLDQNSDLSKKRRFAAAQTEYEEFRRQILRKRNQQDQTSDFQPVDLRRLKQTVFARAPKTVALSYLVGDEETLLLALNAGNAPGGEAGLQIYRLAVKRAELTRQAQEFQEMCLTKSSNLNALSRDLYKLLIAPARKALIGNEHLIIVPDGPLHRLPFQALRDARGNYLIQQYELSYAPSVTALVLMTDAAARRNQAAPGGDGPPMLVVGNPELAVDLKLPNLPNAEAEAKAIARLYRVDALTGKAATETKVKAEIERARRLHFAVHGFANEEAPLYSAIEFARGETDDGTLYARELQDLRLNADLVVLSTCQSASGRETQGEGVLGLAWALFAAGATSSIVTQWSVNDASNAVLMSEFYHALDAPGSQQSEVNKSTALRRAQLKLLNSRQYKHPHHWAPFILVGSRQ